MFSPSLGLFALALAAPPSAAAAPPAKAPAHQIAIVFDSEVFDEDDKVSLSLAGELAAVDTHLAKLEDDVAIAWVTCERVERTVRGKVLNDFGVGASRQGPAMRLMGLTEKRWCALDADVLDVAVDQLKWEGDSAKALLVITGERRAIAGGRRTLDDVARNALHRGIAIHSFVLDPREGQASLTNVLADMRFFMKNPTETLGRPVTHLRHAAVFTGGSYQVTFRMPTPEIPKRRGRYRMRDLTDGELRQRIAETDSHRRRAFMERILRERHETRKPKITAEIKRYSAELGLDGAYGRHEPGRPDILERLAAGTIRPGEVKQDDLPNFLKGQALEPILDAVYDFVDARLTMQRLVEGISTGRITEGKVPPLGGLALAQRLFQPAKQRPSIR